MDYFNPIIRGFYPDPSICYADGYYYLACSSFQYFPGIPLFQSENLIEWTQVGHCLTRLDQLDLEGARSSGGLFAPTLRYHDGRFYMIVTNVSGCGNFFVYTDNIHGDWSLPICVDHQGIDPSLLFDEGKVYYTSTGYDEKGYGIFQCEIDISCGALLTSSRCISRGNGGRFVEAPHLYHISSYFYLLLSEGGTEYGHMVTLFRSESPYGPFESCPDNPVLTNRNLGGYYIQGAGHGDLFSDCNGQYYMVHLAFRQADAWRAYHHLGREVFLEPVTWNQDGWFSVGVGNTARAAIRLEDGVCREIEDETPRRQIWYVKENEACFLRKPNMSCYRFEENGSFSLLGGKDTLGGLGNPTFLGMRQQEFLLSAECYIEAADMVVGQEAGLSVYMDENSHYDLSVRRTHEGYLANCHVYIGAQLFCKGSVLLHTTLISLRIAADARTYSFYVRDKDGMKHFLGEAETKYLSSEVAEGFTGVIIAAFCVSEEQTECGWVTFRPQK